MIRVSSGNEPFLRGETNGDEARDLSDAVFLLRFSFSGGSLSCFDAGEVDDDGVLELTDPIASLGLLFLGVEELAGPFVECGQDPKDDDLD